MATLPTRSAIVSGTTTNAQQKTNLGDQRDFLADLLGTDSSDKAAARDTLGALGIDAIPGYLFGCTMSTAGPSATMSIAAGRVTDSTSSAAMTLSAIAKTTSAWAVGTAQGGLDTGTIANSTWYHWHVIRRPDTGVTDVLFSLSATAPTLPANYTQFRRIGSGRTDVSGNWTPFSQMGDEFLWATSISDYTSVNVPGGLITLSTPPGVKTLAMISGYVYHAGVAGTQIGYASPDGGSNANYGTVMGITGAIGTYGTVAGPAVRTNTNSQILVAIGVGNTQTGMYTHGWIDTRGRDA